jgi:hypothetical protein
MSLPLLHTHLTTSPILPACLPPCTPPLFDFRQITVNAWGIPKVQGGSLGDDQTQGQGGGAGKSGARAPGGLAPGGAARATYAARAGAPRRVVLGGGGRRGASRNGCKSSACAPLLRARAGGRGLGAAAGFVGSGRPCMRLRRGCHLGAVRRAPRCACQNVSRRGHGGGARARPVAGARWPARARCAPFKGPAPLVGGGAWGYTHCGAGRGLGRHTAISHHTRLLGLHKLRGGVSRAGAGRVRCVRAACAGGACSVAARRCRAPRGVVRTGGRGQKLGF